MGEISKRFRPLILKLGFSVGFFLVLFVIYPATVPSVGLDCFIAGGESVWIFYSHYCTNGSGVLLAKMLGFVIWVGVFVVVYAVMSLVFGAKVLKEKG